MLATVTEIMTRALLDVLTPNPSTATNILAQFAPNFCCSFFTSMSLFRRNFTMKHPIQNKLLALSLALVGLSASAANDIEAGKETYSVVLAPKPIVLDGNLGEWAGVPVLADPKF